MKPADAMLTIASLYPTRQPLFLHGPPGVGKSAVCRQAADSLGIDYLDIRGLLHDPSDLKFPLVDLQERTVHWINSIFPRDPKWKGIIVLEELPLCPPLMQGAFLQVTWDRCIGEYRLPEGAHILAAGNRQEDRAGVHRLITPLLSRFIHVDLEVSAEDWHAWAASIGVAPEIRAFLNFRPGLLHQFNPALNERAFPCPRSWELVSRVLLAAPPHLLHQVVAGCVGEGPGAEFVGFTKIYRDLPDVDGILANPKGSPVPREPAVLFALCGALTEKTRKADTQTLKNFVTYSSRLTSEFSVLAMRDACAINQKILLLPEAAAWLKQNKHFLIPGAK